MVLTISIVFLSCQDENTCTTYQRTVFGACNNTKVMKNVNGYKFTLFYAPDSSEFTPKGKKNKSLLHLCLKIEPDDSQEKDFDVVTGRVGSLNKLLERIEKINFSMEKMIELQYQENNTIYPSICHMENTYGLEKGRLFHIIFSDTVISHNLLQNKELTIIWTDKVFSTGKNYFRVSIDEINNLDNKLKKYFSYE